MQCTVLKKQGLFYFKGIKWERNDKDFLTEDKFMPKMHLRQSGFTYSACGRFTKNIRKFKEIGDSGYIYQSKLDKDCFEHGMAHRDFKD